MLLVECPILSEDEGLGEIHVAVLCIWMYSNTSLRMVICPVAGKRKSGGVFTLT